MAQATLPTRQYRPLIEALAAHYRLPAWPSLGTGAEWFEGLVMAESSGDARARRYEPHQDKAGRPDASADADEPGVDDGDIEDDASYGLTQVMGYNARKILSAPRSGRMGYAWMYDAPAALWLGFRMIVAELAAVNGDVERALARYNGGPTGDDPTPNPQTGRQEMRRQDYVRRVCRATAQVQADKMVRTT
jgi:hypothetical protein